MARKAEYVALSTLNEQANGWSVLARGSERKMVEGLARNEITAEYAETTNIYHDTLQKNLRVVSLSVARRLTGRCELGECDHDHDESY